MTMAAAVFHCNGAAIGQAIEQQRLAKDFAVKKALFWDLVSPGGHIPAIAYEHIGLFANIR